MSKKVISLVLIGLLMLSLLVGCNTKPVEFEENNESNNVAGENDKKVKIGLVVGTGGLGDQNFNDIAYSGLKKAEAEFGITLDYVEPQSISDFETLITQFAEDGSYDLITIVTNQASTALEKVAVQFPEQKFSIVDAQVDAPNVKSILKDFTQMTFLNGVLAGLMTTDTSIEKINEEKVVGIITGTDIPNMRAAITGFTAGAKYANPEVEVLTGTVGSFGDPARGKELAKSMYGRKADMILQFAGGSGLGVINEAEEVDLYAFGGASNQNAIAPKNVPASSTENLANRMYTEVKLIVENNWNPGPEVGGLKEGAVDLEYEGSEVEVPQSIKDEVEKIRQLVIDGELELPKSVEEIDNWLKEVK
ncbi:BMP family ABC transporter substrate-binding protein [Proteiniborus sp. MB09-C3]|uniref:BMP family lipoprotein n=1 Tax=Proteiniborus sp. MB09-C3 TaxID=3050072 RepID=UPI002555E3F3|nr:BMP family ABC transporter substrate-binding protein [Proteiniborus sp. MB09-C3]WIV13431.1 BMP family ABC transporter substrate-binding protein [Proteiniborus sp. MB09-C3]